MPRNMCTEVVPFLAFWLGRRGHTLRYNDAMMGEEPPEVDGEDVITFGDFLVGPDMGMAWGACVGRGAGEGRYAGVYSDGWCRLDIP